jgi:hypothetical protein
VPGSASNISAHKDVKGSHRVDDMDEFLNQVEMDNGSRISRRSGFSRYVHLRGGLEGSGSDQHVNMGAKGSHRVDDMDEFSSQAKKDNGFGISSTSRFNRCSWRLRGVSRSASNGQVNLGAFWRQLQRPNGSTSRRATRKRQLALESARRGLSRGVIHEALACLEVLRICP